MRFKPLPDKPGPMPPVALVYGGKHLRVVTVEGVKTATRPSTARELLDTLAGHTVLAGSTFRQIRRATGSEGWLLMKWGKSRAIAWQQLGRVKVRSSRKVFAGLRPAAAFAIVEGMRGELADRGIRFGSMMGISRDLWRATLDEPVTLASRTGRAGFYGPRKEVQPGAIRTVIRGATSVDIRAAYPGAMIREPIAMRMREARRNHLEGEGVARARVVVPPRSRSVYWGPLPIRAHRHSTDYDLPGDYEGWWPIRELRLAVEVGLTVEVFETWEAIRHYPVFEDWWRLMAPLRSRPGAEGQWWKGVSNSLWGSFALSTDPPLFVTLNERDRPEHVRQGAAGPPQNTVYVAAEISARVREQLWREGLTADAFYCDTDAVILKKGSPLPVGCSDDADAGQWRVAANMNAVEVRAPSMYRWADWADQWHYVMAGFGPDAGRALFDGGTISL